MGSRDREAEFNMRKKSKKVVTKKVIRILGKKLVHHHRENPGCACAFTLNVYAYAHIQVFIKL